jgi:hypothetical protein
MNSLFYISVRFKTRCATLSDSRKVSAFAQITWNGSQIIYTWHSILSRLCGRKKHFRLFEIDNSRDVFSYWGFFLLHSLSNPRFLFFTVTKAFPHKIQCCNNASMRTFFFNIIKTRNKIQKEYKYVEKKLV